MLDLPNGTLAGAAVIWEPDAAREPRYITAGAANATGDIVIAGGATYAIAGAATGWDLTPAAIELN